MTDEAPIADPIATDPVGSDRVAADPVAADSVAVDSVAVDSVAADSVAVDSVAADSVAVDSVAVDSVAVDSVAVDSVASESPIEAPYEDDLPVPHRCPWLVHYFLLNPIRRLVENPEKLLQPYVHPGLQVLEPGCGMGYFSLPLARMVGPEGRVLCLDVEPRALRRLEERAGKAGLNDRIVARTCEPRDLGLRDHEGRIDLVVLIHTLHEIEELAGFYHQVCALLSPRGRVLVVERRGHVRPEQFEAMMECARRNGLRVYQRPGLGGGCLAALLARA